MTITCTAEEKEVMIQTIKSSEYCVFVLNGYDCGVNVCRA